MTISLTDKTEEALRAYLKSLPGREPPISHFIENAILEKMEKDKKVA